MILEGPAQTILITKICLAVFSFILGGLLVWMGIGLIQSENGVARRVLSKFKFWGIDLSSPSAGLVVVVVSLAWGLIGIKVMPNYEFDDGHIKISMKDISKPISATISALKVPDGKQVPGIGEILEKFDSAAKNKYLASKDTTVKTEVVLEQAKPVFKLRASSGNKTIEEQYTASTKNGTIEFTPFGVSAIDNRLPEISMKFDCASSIDALISKIESTPERPDIETHKRALNSMCIDEIKKLPPEKKNIFENMK